MDNPREVRESFSKPYYKMIIFNISGEKTEKDMLKDIKNLKLRRSSLTFWKNYAQMIPLQLKFA